MLPAKKHPECELYLYDDAEALMLDLVDARPYVREWAVTTINARYIPARRKCEAIQDEVVRLLRAKMAATGDPVYPEREMIYDGEPVNMPYKRGLFRRFGEAALGFGGNFRESIANGEALPVLLGYGADLIIEFTDSTVAETDPED